MSSSLPSPSSRPPPPDDAFVLCVDMQPVFVSAVVDGARIQRRCEFVVASAQGLGLPVGFSEQVPAKLGPTAPALRALAPAAPTWSKSTFSALADPALRAALLEERRTQHLLLCGIETPVCVYQTALAALGAGLHVTILSDAVGARRPDDARVCLDALARLGAHVLPSESVFYALLHDVGHPYFRAYTQSVKAHHEAVSA